MEGRINWIDWAKFLPPATITGMVLLPLPAGDDHHRLFFHFGLFEKRPRKYECQLEKVLVGTHCALSSLQRPYLSLLVRQVLYATWDA